MRGRIVIQTSDKTGSGNLIENLQLLTFLVDINPCCASPQLVYNSKDSFSSRAGRKNGRSAKRKRSKDDDDKHEKQEVPSIIKDLAEGGKQPLEFAFVSRTNLEYLKIAMMHFDNVLKQFNNNELFIAPYGGEDIRKYLLDEVRQVLDDNRLAILSKNSDLFEDTAIRNLNLDVIGDGRLDATNNKRQPSSGVVSDVTLDMINKEYLRNDIFADEIAIRNKQLQSALADQIEAAKRIQDKFGEGFFRIRAKKANCRGQQLSRRKKLIRRRKRKERLLKSIQDVDEKYKEQLKRVKEQHAAVSILTSAYYKGLDKFYFKCLDGSLHTSFEIKDRFDDADGYKPSQSTIGRNFPKKSAQLVLIHVAKGIYETFKNALSDTFVDKLDKFFGIQMFSDIREKCVNADDPQKILSYPAWEIHADAQKLQGLLRKENPNQEQNETLKKTIRQYRKLNGKDRELFLHRYDHSLGVVNGDICLINHCDKPENYKEIQSRRTKGQAHWDDDTLDSEEFPTSRSL